MIVHLEKEQIKQMRRKLLGDDVYIVFHDVLKQVQKENKTELSPVELFLSARDFVETLLALPDIMEGVEDEMDDLEDEAEGENDAMIVLILASAILRAVGFRRIGLNTNDIILKFYERWNDHNLFFRLLDEGSSKEVLRLMEGKRTRLLSYELESIEEDGEGSKAISELFADMVEASDKMDEGSIKGLLLFLNKYNNDHGHKYDKEVDALYKKLDIKSKKLNIEHAEEIVIEKHVDNEVKGVATGATGISINKE